MGGSTKILITLRPIYVEDLPLILAWRSDREVMRYLPSAPKRPTWEDIAKWWIHGVAEYYKAEYQQRPIGTAVLHDNGEAGILIGEKSLWGHGIGEQMLAEALDLASHLVRIHRPLWAVIHPENVASQKVFTACGFENTHEPARNGQERWVKR